jgi:hypothetical protein
MGCELATGAPGSPPTHASAPIHPFLVLKAPLEVNVPCWAYRDEPKPLLTPPCGKVHIPPPPTGHIRAMEPPVKPPPILSSKVLWGPHYPESAQVDPALGAETPSWDRTVNANRVR